jgi:RNA polymerase sigma factor (sigma-70 family)
MSPVSSEFTTELSPADEDLVAQARQGDLSALDALLRRHQAWVFNLALRMIWRRDLAEDATQEILIKATTHLAAFEGRSRFSTWLYRIAANHLMNVRRSEMEERKMTFRDMSQSLDECLDMELPDPRTLPIETGLLVEEAKLGCITAMLMCLDRPQRLAFILGEIFGASSELGGEVMEISRENFRQLLSRARHDLYQFMNEKCGLVNEANPCRCTKKAAAFMKQGWLDPDNRQFTDMRMAAVREVAPDRLAELCEIDRAHAEVFRDAPFCTPREGATRLREILARSNFS